MSETTTATTATSDIMYSNDTFTAPDLAGNEYVANKISCELGEIYYQTKVDKKGKVTDIASDSSSNGLFISNDKLQELINSGQISKYSWLMQLVLKDNINFLQPAEAGYKKNSSGANPSTYYKNGIFVPLTFSSKNKKQTEIGFQLPYDNSFKLTLRFNDSNIDKPYNSKDIIESIIEHQKDEKNRFGVKEEYRNAGQSSHSGAFFVLNKGIDVTSQVPMVVKDASIDKKKINGKVVMHLPTDFEGKVSTKDLWKGDQLKGICFSMVDDGNGALRLKMHETSILENMWKNLAKSNLKINENDPGWFKNDKDNKEIIIQGQFGSGPDMLLNATITVKTDTLDVTSVPADDGNEVKKKFKKLVDKLNNEILNFDAKNVQAANSHICNLLKQGGVSVDMDKDQIYADQPNGKTAMIYNNGKNLVLDNVCGLNYDQNEVHSYIDGTPNYKEVRLYKDISNNKTYYCEYNPDTNTITSEPKELGDKTILHCCRSNDNPKTYVMKKNNDKWVIVSATKPIADDADAASILKDPDVENFLNGVKQEYDSGQINKIFKQESGESLAEKVKQKLGTQFDIQTESNGVVKPICTYIPSALPGTPGKFVLKNGEEKELNNVDDIKESLKKEDEAAFQEDMENDNTTVLSDGELYDFCASQIGATKPQQQNVDQGEGEDPIKAKAQEYLRNINLFMPGASFKPHVNKHMEKKMKKINNANGFNIKFKPHVNRHLADKMKKIKNLSGFAQGNNGTSIV